MDSLPGSSRGDCLRELVPPFHLGRAALPRLRVGSGSARIGDDEHPGVADGPVLDTAAGLAVPEYLRGRGTCSKSCERNSIRLERFQSPL